MNRNQLRTIWATITAAENGLITFGVTKVDDRINPTIIAVGEEPLFTGHIPYAPVEDKGKNMPTFNFYSADEGSVELEQGFEVVFLCEIKDEGLTYLHWTAATEYRECQKKIDTRLGKRKVAPAKTAPKQNTDNRVYRLSHDNQKFTGTKIQISVALYRYNRESQVHGWPEDCIWEVHDGKRFTSCLDPDHPGPNRLLEPKATERSKVTF